MSQYTLWGEHPAVFPKQTELFLNHINKQPISQSIPQFPIPQFPMPQFPMPQLPMNQLPMNQLPMNQLPMNTNIKSVSINKNFFHNEISSPFNYKINQDGIIEYSTDNINWKQSNVKIVSWINVACSPEGKHTLFATDSGSYYSTNGMDFYKCKVDFREVGMDETGQYQCGVSDDIYISKNYGKDWFNLQVKSKCKSLKKINISQDGKYITVINNTDDVFISDNYGDTFRSCPEIPKGTCNYIITIKNNTIKNNSKDDINSEDDTNSIYIVDYYTNLTILNTGVYTFLNGDNLSLMSGIKDIIENTVPEIFSTSPIPVEIVENYLYVIAKQTILSSSPISSPIQEVSPPQVNPEAQLESVVSESSILEPAPFPALQTNAHAFNTFRSTDDQGNEIPLPKYTDNAQSFMIQVHNTSDSNQWLEMNHAYVTISKNGYVLVCKDPNRQGPNANLLWTKIDSIKINSWIVLSGSYEGKYITIASDAGTFTSSTFGEKWTKIDYPFVFVGMNGSGQFQVGITPTECYISGNYGNSWTLYSVPEDNYQIVCVSSDATSILLSGSYQSYLISNGKTTIIKIPQGTVINASIQTMGNIKRYTIQINGKGLYQSTDGSLWTLLKSLK
jgi:hypothetical protein